MKLAGELKNREIEPLHLFFALTSEQGSVAAEILKQSKVDLKILEQMLFNLPAVPEANKAIQKNIPTELQLPPLSSYSKLALEKSLIVAQKNGHNYLGTEHLLSALMEMHDPRLEDFFKLSNFNVEEINKQIETTILSASQFPEIGEVAEAAEKIQESLMDAPAPVMPPARTGKIRGKRNDSALDYFSVNLTDPEAQKEIDPVIGRELEIERVVQILSRRTKNNPVLLGDPGVGKTAIVEGLAKKIMNGEVPDMLRNKKIFAVDLGLLIAGTIYRGEFEARLKQVIDEASGNPDIILFIDEIHNIVGAGSSQGTMDAANLLKPALARGQIHCIGSTTPAEFKKHIENDAALERRFQPIIVREPTLEGAIQILKGIRINYEEFHRVKISDEAVVAAVELSSRHISGKFLPDKAIDLLDETSAAKRLAEKNTKEENILWNERQELRQIRAEKEKAALSDRFGEALKLKEKESRLAQEVRALEKNANQQKSRVFATIDENDIIRQIAKITGAEPSELVANNKEKFVKLEKNLRSLVVGQDETISQVVNLVRQAELDLSSADRPRSSFLFVGPSGVGKTELAKVLSKSLYPNQDSLIKLDMSEFGEGYGASKLLGSPAGYVGYKDTNQFTDRLKLNPYSVVLFDEIDKAHSDIMKLLLQMLEEGEITDSTGKKISLKHAIIILTTAYGAEELKKEALGFDVNKKIGKESEKRLFEKLKDRFSPELINRLDQICFFNELSAKDLEKIAELELKQLNERLRKYQTKIMANDESLKWLVEQLAPTGANARDVRQKVRTEIEKLVAEKIINGKVSRELSLTADKKQKQLQIAD